MKFLIPFLVLIGNLSFAQKSEPQPGTLKPAVYVPSIMSMHANQNKLTYDLSRLDLAPSGEYISRPRMFLPYQYNLSNCPSGDPARMHQIIMGTSMQQTFTVGNTKFVSNYIFDMMGNLRDYQFSIPLGKDN